MFSFRFRPFALSALFGFSALSGPLFAQKNYDILPPELSNVVYPAQIDARGGNQSVVVTAKGRDPLSGEVEVPPVPGGVASGVAYGWVEFARQTPTGEFRYLSVNLYPDYPDPNQPPPTPGEQVTLSGMLSVPSCTLAGTYAPYWAQISDKVGNYANYADNSPLIQSLPAISVLANGPCPDVTAPVLHSLAISPSTHDVSQGAQSFTFTMDISDDSSGVDIRRINVWSQVLAVNNQTYSRNRNYPVLLKSGNSISGRYEAIITIPRYSPGGKWFISIQLFDSTGNGRLYKSADLRTAGFSDSFQVIDSNADLTPPTLVSMRFPDPLDPNKDAILVPNKDLNIEVVTSDLQSGVGRDGVSGCNPSISFTSQHNQFLSILLSPMDSVPKPTKWKGTLRFPELSEPGSWFVEVSMCDRAGNWPIFAGPTMPAGIPAYVFLVYPTDPDDGQIDPGGGTIQDKSSTASITVPVGLSPKDAAGNVVAAPRVAINLFQSVNAESFSGYENHGGAYVSIIFSDPNKIDPASGLPTPMLNPVFPAPGVDITIPQVLSPNYTQAELDNLKLWRYHNGNKYEARYCGVDGPQKTVGPLGSVTFHHICEFSVFFLLNKTGLPGDLDGDGAVGCQDVAIVKASFGKGTTSTGFDARADINRDGVVNILDLSFVLKLIPSGTVCR